MMRPARSERLPQQLRLLLEMTGANPWGWLVGVVAASLVLALLDTIGVAAMIPLTQLLSGTAEGSTSVDVIAGIVGTDDPAVLIPVVALGIALLFLIKSIATIVFRWWMLGRTSRIAASVAAEMMRRYMLAPYVRHRTRRMSEVYRNIGESTFQAASVLLAVLSVLTDGMMLAAIVVVLYITSPLVTLLTVLLFGLLVFGLQMGLRSTQSRIGEEAAAMSLEAWGFLVPALDGFREARLSSSARIFVDGYREAKIRSAMASRQLAIVSELPRYALEIGFVVAIAGISIVLFTAGSPGQALTVLGVFAAAALRGLPTLNRISANFGLIRSGQVSLRILQGAVEELSSDTEHEEVPRAGATSYQGDIVVKDVTYSYPDSTDPVLSHVSVRIPQNHTVAFVGSSGAGKSTLLDLTLGLLEPTQGSIECGGRSIFDDRASWYSELGVVPQDVFLINDTLAANVAFGAAADDIDRSRVEEVLALARLTDLVRSLPLGLDTVVGERGVRLSGGQRQRIGLARALYRQPSVLVLDEATSALDNVTEREITDTLAQLNGSLTILIVAHRLSTVKNADSIVFLKDGSVEAEGTFGWLRTHSRDFARLVQLGELD
jgi:ABC-type multidrug transport system fused ATPase/permease subunit